MTSEVYKKAMEFMRMKTAELMASPEAAEKFIRDGGLGYELDHAEDMPVSRKNRATPSKKTRNKKVPA